MHTTFFYSNALLYELKTEISEFKDKWNRMIVNSQRYCQATYKWFFFLGRMTFQRKGITSL